MLPAGNLVRQRVESKSHSNADRCTRIPGTRVPFVHKSLHSAVGEVLLPYSHRARGYIAWIDQYTITTQRDDLVGKSDTQQISS